jgi:putative SOS response-associated peptidase YedK
MTARHARAGVALGLPPAGEQVRSFAIVTTTPNALCAELHDRMPVVLKPDVGPVWLGEQPADVPRLKSLLKPYPADEMICWPVSVRVGNVCNNDRGLIEPIAEMGNHIRIWSSPWRG